MIFICGGPPLKLMSDIELLEAIVYWHYNVLCVSRVEKVRIVTVAVKSVGVQNERTIFRRLEDKLAKEKLSFFPAACFELIKNKSVEGQPYPHSLTPLGPCPVPLIFNCLYSPLFFCGLSVLWRLSCDGGGELGQPTGEQVRRTPRPSKRGIRLPN